MTSIYEPLSKQNFRHRIMDSFPGNYLTTISIIQGVALGILASKTFGHILTFPITSHFRFFPYSIISFILLILVSYEYCWFIGIFRWSPKIWDTFIPFALGFSEIGPMFYLTDLKNWWFWTGIFCFVGALGFFYTLSHCEEAVNENKAFKLISKTLRKNIIIALISSLFCIIMSVISYMEVLIPYWYLDYIFLSALFITAIYMIRTEERFLENLKKALYRPTAKTPLKTKRQYT